jgi:hypothetical protein
VQIKYLLSFFIAVILFFPTTLFYFYIGSSLAPGVGLSALIVIAFALLTPALLRPIVFGTIAAVLIFSFVMLHLLISAMFLEVDFVRAISSSALMMVIIVAAVVFAAVLQLSTEKSLILAVNNSFYIIAISVFLYLTGLQPIHRELSQPIFPFTEASHLAIVFVPVLIFQSVRVVGFQRIIFIAFGITTALSIQSLTLLVGMCLVLAVCARSYVYPVIVTLVAIGGILLDLTYYADRLQFTNSTNLSALVFIQGWQIMLEAFQKSYAWGIGFQQLGLHDAHTDASDIIFILVNNQVNLLDGGLTFAKFAGEFGVFGVLLSAVFLAMAVMSIIQLRKFATGSISLPAYKVFAFSVLLSYPIELFIRGLGYFTPTFFLAATSLAILLAGRPRGWHVSANPAAVASIK